MIQYTFPVDESYMSQFFKPIKNKPQLIELLMNSLKYMLMNQPLKGDRIHGKMVLVTGKRSRLFFFSEKKYFSIAFPFVVKFENNAYSFNFKNRMNIDAMLTSKIILFINDNDFHSSCSLEFVSEISEYQEMYNDYYWEFIREMLLMEDGYLRYDYDPVNYEKHGESDVHPLNHYDLFYSGNATFKLGLKEKIRPDQFMGLLDVESDCQFVG